MRRSRLVVVGVGLALFAIACLGIEFFRRPQRPPSARSQRKPSEWKALIREYKARSSDTSPPPPGTDKSLGQRARRLVFSTLVRRGEGWCYYEEPLGPPLPVAAGFVSLVSALRSELGDAAGAVLSQLAGEAQSDYHKKLYIALLSALNDTGSEELLNAFALNQALPAQARGIAMYGLSMLSTPSAWQTVEQIWRTLDENPDLKKHAYWSMGRFGELAYPLLLKEAEKELSNDNKGLAYRALYALSGSDVTERLEKLAEQHPSPSLREAAFRALLRNTDASRITVLLDRLGAVQDAEGRDMMATALANHIVHVGMKCDEKDIGSLVSQFSTFPVTLQLALYTNPAVRASLPVDYLLRFQPSSDNVAFYLNALASDPSFHDRLAEIMHPGAEEGSIFHAYFALRETGGYLNEKIASAVVPVALDPTAANGSRDYAWRILELGPAEPRAQALAQAPAMYARFSNDLDRLDFIGSLGNAGHDATPILLGLLQTEQSPSARLELAATLLSIPGNLGNDRVLSELRPLIAAEYEHFLSGDAASGIQYAFIHTRGLPHGLQRFSTLVRDLFMAYGKPEQVPSITRFSSQLQVPPHAAFEGESLPEEWVRSYVNNFVVQSIDAIQARSGN